MEASLLKFKKKIYYYKVINQPAFNLNPPSLWTWKNWKPISLSKKQIIWRLEVAEASIDNESRKGEKLIK